GTRLTVAMAHGTVECLLWHANTRHAEGRSRSAGARVADSCRPEGFRGQLSEGVVTRHAPALRAGAHLRAEVADPADGRALRCPRCADQAHAGRLAASTVAGAPPHRGVHHARPRRSGSAVGPGDRDERTARAYRG